MIFQIIFFLLIGVFLSLLYTLVLFACVKNAKTLFHFHLFMILRLLAMGVLFAFLFKMFKFRGAVFILIGFTVTHLFLLWKSRKNNLPKKGGRKP